MDDLDPFEAEGGMEAIAAELYQKANLVVDQLETLSFQIPAQFA